MTHVLQYSAKALYQLANTVLGKPVSKPLWNTLRTNGISIAPPTKRGQRGGVQLRRPIHVVVSAFRVPNAALNVNTTTGVCVHNLHYVNIDTSSNAVKQQHDNPTCLLLNTQSVRNKSTLLCDYVSETNVDLTCLTETWLKPSYSAIVNDLVPPSYGSIGVCRSDKRGGGVGILHINPTN